MRPNGCLFETRQRFIVVPLHKTIFLSLVLVQPRKTENRSDMIKNAAWNVNISTTKIAAFQFQVMQHQSTTVSLFVLPF